MKDQFSISLPEAGETSCSVQVRVGVRGRGWELCQGALSWNCQRSAGSMCPGRRVSPCADAGNHHRGAQAASSPATLVVAFRLACYPARRTSGCLAATNSCFEARVYPQTFLLSFDPEDHEDADEWRVYEGPLASKDLHKVGKGARLPWLGHRCCPAEHAGLYTAV